MRTITITAKDCQWSFYRGSGKGGQKRNKTENAVRCTHVLSQAQSYSEKSRSKEMNKKEAFIKMIETEKFKNWLSEESIKLFGDLMIFEKKIIKDFQEVKVVFYPIKKWETPLRKKKKRKPSEKDKTKAERQKSKKLEKNYLNNI